MASKLTIHDYFNKTYEFVGNENWTLPSAAYNSPLWQIDKFQRMKTELNATKSQLSKFDLDEWSNYTKNRDPSSLVIFTLRNTVRIELLTQAWCKFYECLSKFPILPQDALHKQQMSSLHLCEAPGAFISALNHFLYTHHRRLQWQWIATTLNPNYEGNNLSQMINNDSLIKPTINNWDFGLDNTGDIMKYYNHNALVEKCKGVMLVTADGSVNCMHDPGEQENYVHFLHYCEIITGLKVLAKCGTLVVKMFTLFECGSICLMYLLNCCFKKVFVFKPCTSKSGNSEVYIICLDYKGVTVLKDLLDYLVEPYKNTNCQNLAMFDLNEIHPEFLQQLEECATAFMNLQSFTINENISNFKNGSLPSNLQREIADYFLCQYLIATHLPNRCKLIKTNKKFKTKYQTPNWTVNKIIIDPKLNHNNLLVIKYGRAIETVTISKFCSVNLNKLVEVNDSIYQTIFPYVSVNHNVISSDMMDYSLPQYLFQKRLFYLLKNQLDSEMDTIITGIPLLTRFLVGIVYILGTGYETVLVHKDGVLVLRGPIKNKLETAKQCYSTINSVYNEMPQEQFLNDILQVVPNSLLENKAFYEAICTYNNGLYSQ